MTAQRGPRRLLLVLAHPDDESLGNGGTLAKYAAEGVETYLVTATRGERGWWGTDETYPGPEALGRTREQELRNAAKILGVQSVELLTYQDGELDRADPDEVISLIAGHIRRIRPQVIVTFDPYGAYGHADHIAICQFTTAATMAAASAAYQTAGQEAPHQTAKLYYMAWDQAMQDAYQAAFGELVMEVDGIQRRAQPWPDWALTTRIDTTAHWRTVWEAVSQHQSQLPGYEGLRNLPPEHHAVIWGRQSYYRAYSLVNAGRAIEDDLFDGLA